MKFALSLTLAATLAGAVVTTAHAQSAQVPNPANPTPLNPVATDGTPLPQSSSATGVFTGRSVAVGSPLGFVGDAVDAGVGTAGAVVGTGLGVAGATVKGGAGAVGLR